MPRDKNDARLIRMIQRVVPILMIFSFALFLRLIYLHDYKENPLFSHPQIDAETFVTQAGEMARGTFFSVNPYSFYQPPLYPFLLAIFFKLFTFDLYWLHLLQMILGSCNCVLIYTLGKQCFPAPVALLAGLAAGCYWPLIYFDGELLVPTLAIFLILTFLLFFIKFLVQQNRLHLVVSGLLLGFAALTVPNILIFGWLIVPVLILKHHSNYSSDPPWRATSVMLLIYGMASFLPIAPVTLYNWKVEKVLVPISHNGGLNFYIGNSPREAGALALRPGEEWDYFIRTPQRENPHRKLSSADFSRYWYKKSFAYFRQQPIEFLKNELRKGLLFLDGYEIKRNMDLYFFRQRFSRLMKWPLLSFGMVFPFALLGLLWPKPQSLCSRIVAGFILAYAASVVLFFVTSRYRLPIVPLALLFAASATLRLLQVLRAGPFPWRPLSFLLFSGLLINTDLFGWRPSPQERIASEAESWYYLARAMGDQAQNLSDPSERAVGYLQAIQTMRTAARLDTCYAYPLNFIGVYLVQIAKDILKDIKAGPDDRQEAAVLVEQVEANLVSAERYYRQAIQMAPKHIAPVYNLCLALYYRNILDYNYSHQPHQALEAKMLQRCDEIEQRLTELIQQDRFEETRRYVDLKYKASMQKEAILHLNRNEKDRHL